MMILDSILYNSDIERVTKSLNWLECKNNKTFFITGATGLICSAVVDVLEYINVSRNLGWKIIIAVRNIDKAKERFQKYEIYSNLSLFKYDLTDDFEIPDNVDYIIHGAANAFPAIFSAYPVETLTGCINGLKHILDYTVIHKDTRVLYISSSEVYGILHNDEAIKENECGIIDILSPRSCYSIGKQAAETLCTSFVSEYNSDCVIVRPGHIYGPTASEKDNRVSSLFMYSAAKGQDLVMKSNGEQLSSYCYCLDCASAIIVSLFLGKKGEAYNISNRNSICTIKEMAICYAKVANVKVIYDEPVTNEKLSFNPMLNSSLNSEKIERHGWKSVFSKEEGFYHSVLICKDLIEKY